MTRWLKASAAAIGLSVLAAGALPASAAPVPSQSSLLNSAAADQVTAVRVERRKARRYVRRAPRPHVVVYGRHPGWGGPDTVGSLGYDGYGYGYNRFSGQRYQSCVEDLGYGRVRPCDAGRR